MQVHEFISMLHSCYVDTREENNNKKLFAVRKGALEIAGTNQKKTILKQNSEQRTPFKLQ